MTPQVIHSLRQYLIMIVLAALGVVVQNQTGILNDIFSAIGLSEPYAGFLAPIILTALAASVRWVEGLRDSKRAEEGHIIPADVAYQSLADLADNPSVPQVEAIGDDIYVEDPSAQVIEVKPRFLGDDWLP